MHIVYSVNYLAYSLRPISLVIITGSNRIICFTTTTLVLGPPLEGGWLFTINAWLPCIIYSLQRTLNAHTSITNQIWKLNV